MNQADTTVRTRRWEEGAVVEEGFPLEEVSDHLDREGSLLWVDLCEPDRAHLQRLADELEIGRASCRERV